MAGLLDLFDNPDAQMGLGLLAAASPRADAAGFGQRIMEGVNNAQGMRNAQMQRQMQQLQFQQAMRRNQMINDAMAQDGPQTGLTAPTSPEVQQANNSPVPLSNTLGSGTFGVGATNPQTVQPTVQATQAPQVNGSQPWSQGKIRLFAMSGDPGLQKAAELEQARQLAGQTDIGKLMDQAGITDPTVRSQLTQSALAKANYIAPVAGRAGGYIIYADGRKEFNPQVPEGMIGKQNTTTGQMDFSQDPNIIAGIQAGEAAKLAGKNQQTPTKRFNTDTRQYEYSTAANDVAAGSSPPANQQAADDQMAIFQKELSKPGISAQDKAGIQREIAFYQQQNSKAGITAKNYAPDPAPGVAAGQTDLQTELSNKWTKLSNANSEAQNTVSYLSAIKDQADKAAVGPLSDKLQYANGLLAAAGVSDKALDATTANNLLDKYSNQIITRLGQGGLGTDAARSMLTAAYPNSHMTKDAIYEASDNLIGANKMLQAKNSILLPHANARDPQNYNVKEQAFDSNADPALFTNAAKYAQLKKSNPTAARAFAQQITAKDPSFGSRLGALENLGVKF